MIMKANEKNKTSLLLVVLIATTTSAQASLSDSVKSILARMQNNAIARQITARRVGYLVLGAGAVATTAGLWWWLKNRAAASGNSVGGQQPVPVASASSTPVSDSSESQAPAASSSSIAKVGGLPVTPLKPLVAEPRSFQIEDFASHINNKKQDGFSSQRTMYEKNYELFALYYTDSNEQELKRLTHGKTNLPELIVKHIERLSDETKEDYFVDVLQAMNEVIKPKEIGFYVKLDAVLPTISAGIILLDKQKRRLYGATIGDIEIYAPHLGYPIERATRSFLGQKDTITSKDIYVRCESPPSDHTGVVELVMGRNPRGTPEHPQGFPSRTFDFATKGESEDLKRLLAKKDVSVAVKISY